MPQANALYYLMCDQPIVLHYPNKLMGSRFRVWGLWPIYKMQDALTIMKVAAVSICECEQITKILEQAWKKQQERTHVLARCWLWWGMLTNFQFWWSFYRNKVSALRLWVDQSRCELISEPVAVQLHLDFLPMRISIGAQYVTLQKYSSHSRLVI
jgi:hypothetical protein